jgi:hypothetical protein
MGSNSCALDYWLQAEEEFSKDPSFDDRVNRRADNVLRLVPLRYQKKPEKTRKAVIGKIKIDYIKRRAYFIWFRNMWLSENAFYLSLKNPDNSAYANWCQASIEYDKFLRSNK